MANYRASRLRGGVGWPRGIAAASLLLAAAAAGCVVGDLGGGPSESQPPDPKPQPAAELGQAPLRRINRAEYDNTVRDLFKVTSAPASAWPAGGITSGFDNDVSGQGATADLVDQMMRSAEQVADEAVTHLDVLLPCSAQSSVDPTTCGTTFIEAFGHRAYRRPLTADDRDRLGKALAWGIKRSGLKTGIRVVIMTLLQSPHFLYRPEIGTPDGVDGKTLALTDHEIATRLSYLLLNSCPDAALLAAADKGEVHTLAQVEAQTERLLESPAGRLSIDRFFHQWLPFDKLGKAVKAPDLFPQFTDATKAAMADGTTAFLEHVVFDSKDGSLSELMTAKYAFVNASTAPLYGLSGKFGTGFEQATPTEPRAGLLTQVGVMAALADNVQSSPVARGKFVYQGLLCQSVGSPPANLPGAGVPPTPDPTKTTRERFDEHRKNPACAGCHQVMDPLGFGLESYDAIGRYRATENGKPIDATGDLSIDGKHLTFNGAIELAKFVAESPLTRQCFASKWFTYAFGRTNNTDDAFTVDALQKAFAGPTSPIKQLFLAVTATPAFTHRNTPVIEACAQ